MLDRSTTGFRPKRLFASAGQFCCDAQRDIPTASRALADHAIDVPASEFSEGERGCSLAYQ
jgi:hypothetical protein